MAPKSDSAEGIVLNFVTEQNRPLNPQNVADSLQKFNLKKAAVKRCWMGLRGGKISFKEYGKQKVYLAGQDQFDIPNNEELNPLKKRTPKCKHSSPNRRKYC